MSEIDKIIGEFDTWCRCENKECMLAENYTNDKAKLLQLVLEVIGVDEKPAFKGSSEYWRNSQRAEQRQKAYELFGEEQDNGS